MHYNTKPMDNLTEQRSIAFSPPDITEAEIEAVAQVLRSGWITTGPQTKAFERALVQRTGAAGAAALNSATAALECALRICDIGPGDEVIVPAYTYTASASVVDHVGAKIVLVDAQPGSFILSAEAVRAALTPRTKAVIAVDFAGIMADYDALFAVLDDFEGWEPANSVQACVNRPFLIADAAHSLGAVRNGVPSGAVADFTAFSFHAVKNVTTAEGGALAWRDFGFDSDELYHQVMLFSLHGQTKDALQKSNVGAWEYDIAFPGYKWNMTDIQAALGLVQLDRYEQLHARRHEIVARYERNLQGSSVEVLPHAGEGFKSSAHLLVTRVAGATEDVRNAIIDRMGQAGVACNVHYKPLPLLSAYCNLGFDAADFPQACALYENELTLPLHTLLTDDDVDYICAQLLRAIEEC